MLHWQWKFILSPRSGCVVHFSHEEYCSAKLLTENANSAEPDQTPPGAHYIRSFVFAEIYMISMAVFFLLC